MDRRGGGGGGEISSNQRNSTTSKSIDMYRKQIYIGIVWSCVVALVVISVVAQMRHSIKSHFVPTPIDKLKPHQLESNQSETSLPYLKLENTAMQSDQVPIETSMGKSISTCRDICSSNSSCAIFSATKLGMCRFFDSSSLNKYRNYTGITLFIKN